MKGKRRQEKAGNKKIPYLRVVEIRYVPTPDADLRLSRAIDILLTSAAKEPEVSISDKEEELPKDSRPEKIADQSDGEKDESKSG